MYTPEDWATRTTVDAELLQKIETGVQVAGNTVAGSVWLDGYPGATDDAKLANAIADLTPDTYKRVILLGDREYVFTQSIGQPFDHFAIRGIANTMTFGELGVPVTTRVRLDVPGPWINVTGTMRGLDVRHIDFRSTRTDTEFIRSTGVLWAFLGDTLQFRGFYGVLGSASQKCLTNYCITQGPWQINGFRNTPFHVGGSDSLWFRDSLNIGSGGLGPGAGGTGDQQYMMKFVGCSNTIVGPAYLSCNNGWRGVYVDGARDTGRGLFFHGLRTEGQTATATSAGSVLQVNGGAVGFSQIVVAQGMTNPSLTTAKNSWGTPDGGLVCIRGADTQVAIDQMCVWHAQGVASSVPVLHVTKHASPAAPLPVSPRVRMTNVLMGGKQGTPTWEQLPVAQQTAAACITGDDSYTIITG